MVKKLDRAKARAKRHFRVRNKISGTAECPRLNVFRSSKHIYAQIIDDLAPDFCLDLMEKAGVSFPKTKEGRFFRWLVMEHTNETVIQWQKYLDEADIKNFRLYDKNIDA